MNTKATIKHHQGSTDVEGFERVKEIDEERQTLRVIYPEPAQRLQTAYTPDGEVYYKEFHSARVVELEVKLDDDDDNGEGDWITVD